MAVDYSPASEPVSSVDVSAVSADTPGDGYGTTTQNADTIIWRVVPPKSGRYTRVNYFSYDCSTTAHTLTMMIPFTKSAVSTDAAAGQAVIRVDKIGTVADGGLIAANDFFVTVNEDGVYVLYKIASISGRNITVTTSVGSADGSGVVTKIESGAPVWYLGAPADHSARQFTMKASTVTTLGGGGISLCTTTGKNQPIVVHVDNATAAGKLTALSYGHPKL